MKALLVTVDTELSNFPDGQGLWGRVGSENWGLPKLFELFDELELRATFFLDVYARETNEVAVQQRAAEAIRNAGFDLQLHTHPGPAFDHRRPQMRQYSIDEQSDILAFGAARIRAWAGIDAIAHRAGDWAADAGTLQALRRRGFRADFSGCPWSASCSIDAGAIAGNGWTRIDGMLCAVGTCYRDRLTGRTRRLDLGGSSFREVRDMASLDINPLIMTLHSFSLLRHNRTRTRFAPDTDYAERLRAFARLARDQGYRSVAVRDAIGDAEALSALPWAALPTSHAAASCAGLLKSLRRRLVA